MTLANPFPTPNPKLILVFNGTTYALHYMYIQVFT